MYYAPLCDIDVFQRMPMSAPGEEREPDPPRIHRSCPPNIREGYAIVSSPPMPLHPQVVPAGRYEIRAEATTQDMKRIFCLIASFDVTA
ncbi:hypothetical protein GQ53DRAFT_745929 [Thozetella sp. PMI_491]|nr:hypothetical protein GQ53DRAFT_745929 [Thozetella sp. PMI_491]